MLGYVARNLVSASSILLPAKDSFVDMSAIVLCLYTSSFGHRCGVCSLNASTRCFLFTAINKFVYLLHKARLLFCMPTYITIYLKNCRLLVKCQQSKGRFFSFSGLQWNTYQWKVLVVWLRVFTSTNPRRPMIACLPHTHAFIGCVFLLIHH